MIKKKNRKNENMHLNIIVRIYFNIHVCYIYTISVLKWSKPEHEMVSF